MGAMDESPQRVWVKATVKDTNTVLVGRWYDLYAADESWVLGMFRPVQDSS